MEIDALVLRDGMWGQLEYAEAGPYGSRASSNPADMERWHEWTASLVRETKQANPECLLIGYSTSDSAVSEWRLDRYGAGAHQVKKAFLTPGLIKSWAGAWEGSYLDYLLGYTFQLSQYPPARSAASLHPHPALCADRRVGCLGTLGRHPRHTLQGAMGDLGLYSRLGENAGEQKVPRGMYFGWMNHGNGFTLDGKRRGVSGHQCGRGGGGCAQRPGNGRAELVYNREYLLWLNREHPDWLVKEFIDDHAAMLMKWQVPILSVTRLEWLPMIQSDILFILQTPGQLSDDAAGAIL